MVLNAGTLTTLHSFGAAPVLEHFASIEAFYKVLDTLPFLQDLRIPHGGINVVESNSPAFQVLHLRLERNSVAKCSLPYNDWCHLHLGEENVGGRDCHV